MTTNRATSHWSHLCTNSLHNYKVFVNKVALLQHKTNLHAPSVIILFPATFLDTPLSKLPLQLLSFELLIFFRIHTNRLRKVLYVFSELYAFHRNRLGNNLLFYILYAMQTRKIIFTNCFPTLSLLVQYVF